MPDTLGQIPTYRKYEGPVLNKIILSNTNYILKIPHSLFDKLTGRN
ncbi:MAG: hypothetical protein ACI9GW_003251 [Halieaceae bacterium]|jgi:hypothetical protein